MRKPIVVRLHDKQVTERDPGHRPNPLQPVCDQRSGRFGQPLKLGIAVKATPFTVTGATRRDGGLTVDAEPIRGTERQGSEPSSRRSLKLVDRVGRPQALLVPQAVFTATATGGDFDRHLPLPCRSEEHTSELQTLMRSS